MLRSSIEQDCTLSDFDQNWLRRFRRSLKTWYAAHARPLPWRGMGDPYPIWISEIMLQQTTVAAVIPYFERFLTSFPTLAALAAASEEDVLRHWEGLGYYSRARNIHKTAQRVVVDHAGEFPNEVSTLVRLPGIGRYTAGAIASFAFDCRAPIVEANTLRLYSRLLGLRGDPRSAEGQRRLWEFATHILPQKSPGLFNQALMELGATLCTPDRPACDRCPVRACCAAFAAGLQAEIPQAAVRVPITPVTEVAIAVRMGGRLLLMKRPAGERWAGLWDFLRFPREAEAGDANGASPSVLKSVRRTSGKSSAHKNGRTLPFHEPVGAERRRLAEQVFERTGVRAEIGELLTEIRHSVTRFRITLRCYTAEWSAGDIADSPLELRWVAPDQIADYPLSMTGRKLAKLLCP